MRRRERRETLLARFWRQVEVRSPSECWPWRGGRLQASGRGRFALGHRESEQAHRLAWALANGRNPPSRRSVLHSCDNLACVNPAHLRLGNAQENADDRVARGRVSCGERHFRARLTWRRVLAARRRAAKGESLSSIARRFGVTIGSIKRVVDGDGWARPSGGAEPIDDDVERMLPWEGEAARFFSKVNIGPPGECWPWRGAKQEKGYGAFGSGGRVMRAHRFAWLLLRGEIKDGLWVLHECDSRDCVNPSHLRLGTAAENTGDMVERERDPGGERSGLHRITWGTVREIRRFFRSFRGRRGAVSAASRRFGVDVGDVSRITRGLAWRHSGRKRVSIGAGQKTSGTAPEIKMRAACRRAGLPRPQWNAGGVPGSPDLAWPRARVALFVHGCFWHGCRTCRILPVTNRAWWRRKFEKNRRRDARVVRLLRRQGWMVVVSWEHEDPDKAAARVARALSRRGKAVA